MFPPAEHKIASALFAVEASCLLNLSGKNAYLAYECAAVRGVELLGARPDNADLTVDLALQRHQFLKQGPVIDITDNQEIDVALSVDATTRPRAEDRGSFNPRVSSSSSLRCGDRFGHGGRRKNRCSAVDGPHGGGRSVLVATESSTSVLDVGGATSARSPKQSCRSVDVTVV
jgi:hypothetical protein